MNDRSIYCCESHDLPNRNLHWLAWVAPSAAAGDDYQAVKKVQVGCSEITNEVFFLVVLRVIMKGPCVRNVWPVWQF